MDFFRDIGLKSKFKSKGAWETQTPCLDDLLRRPPDLFLTGCFPAAPASA
jgi:hypothetical protein